MDTPLLVTADPSLAEEVSRLAAAAGVSVPVVLPSAALARWVPSPVVLVGADVATELWTLRPVRRPGVFLVSWTEPPPGAYRDALLLGATSLVELPAGGAHLAELLGDLDDPSAGRREAPLVGVLSGSGGAGATTFACALGQAAARRGPCLVVDLDPLGPGCDRVLGVCEEPGVRWDALGRASGRLSARSLRDAVPRLGAGPGVLAWPTPSTSSPPSSSRSSSPAADPVGVREALSAARRGHDLVVVDLPRTLTPEVAETLARCTRLLVVVAPSVPGIASAARLVAALPDRDALPLGLLVRGTALDPHRVAEVVGAPLVTTVPDHRRLAESLELGGGPLARRGPLHRATREVLAALDLGLYGAAVAA
jgi:secretion/DNA translocation related CpaE-like protein